ncbi:hypothetical protein C5167_010748 [Papaver somniferum]|uniref:Uncharacterized protein n=1 Tax=Papaver somniferum TaxID=3469 RepID=A0A4Y7K522_PAPSO|nr:hypothetical protein C5167_010748 [Papaver somniferum]
MELDQGLGEASEKSVCSRDMPSTQLALESISLFSKGISLILYRWLRLRCSLHMEECQPHDVKSVRSRVIELVRIYFKYGIGLMQGIYEMLMYSVCNSKQVGGKLYNLYQEILQGKYDSIEELRKTTSWFGEDYMQKLRTAEEEELIRVRTANADRAKISRRRRQKVQAYFL